MKYSKVFIPAILFLILLAVWHFISRFSGVAFWILPGPLEVLKNIFSNLPLIWHHLQPTLSEALAGLLLSIVSGMSVAILMNSSALVRFALYPYMVVSQTVPIIAVAPLLIIWFGYGISAKIFAVVLMCFFPIALAMFDGLRSVDIDQERLLKSMGASKLKIMLLLKLPAAMPNFFTGLKLAATYSVMGAVIGEWLGGNAGLGIYLIRATKSYQTAQVFAVITVIVLLSMLLYGIVAFLERILLAWNYRHEDEFVEPEPHLLDV